MRVARNQLLNSALNCDVWDIIVIGGGATGLGVAVDAASRGYNTLLLEAVDFGKGTSSRSTKLIHGGVRYLRQGNVKLVYKALKERGYLMANAPHLVTPLRFVIPCTKWWHQLWYGLGLRLYDLLAGSLSIGPSRILTREQTLDFLPGIKPGGVKGGVEYWDAQFDDTRLLVSLLLTCINNGGTALNYMRVTELIKTNGIVSGVKVRDELANSQHEFRAKVVVNATGVFTDAIRSMDDRASRTIIRPAQGAHLVLDSSFVSENTALLIPGTDDGRVIFAVPWHSRVLLGTTDVSVDEVSEEPRPMNDEIDYLLQYGARYLSRPPSRKDVLSVFAGLRPLVKAVVTPNRDTKTLSRDHTLKVSSSKLVTITGGKWTTYRHMAQDAVNRAARTARLDRLECKTKTLKLVDNEIPEENSAEGTVLIPSLPYTETHIRQAVNSEMAVTLEDVLARRTRCLFLDARASLQIAPRVAAILRDELGWDFERMENEIHSFQQVAASYIADQTD